MSLGASGQARAERLFPDVEVGEDGEPSAKLGRGVGEIDGDSQGPA